MVSNDNNELIPTRTVTRWKTIKLNKATRKDHFPLPFIDQMLDRLVAKAFYYFLDEKTTFTCPYGTFAFRRMPFGLCNALVTCQHCMMAIFSDMVEKLLEVFMDDFSVFGYTFENYFKNLELVLYWCEETNLVLNWEKCHFMQGIVANKKKIKLIEKLPPPSVVKDICSFLCHSRFYQQFIKYFSKISKPLCTLLEHNKSFNFNEPCLQAFEGSTWEKKGQGISCYLLCKFYINRLTTQLNYH
ncbi:Retrovirus-related Pol polyprotein from transposon 17.6 [Gossypium australe]|uniref:Retrovirus-related Pol polyprotein from transposon 17.6 n=1 Tax=Gossypium australe TaxID=47621 RepID=A0A5B6VNV7_9ROSI|nr:Retrovirus-related Pol polyprotein from transposon 17.6 [Gossypium australe]